MAAINPSNPNQGKILNQSPVLGPLDRAQQEQNKKMLEGAVKPNLKNMKKSITPSVRSKPYGGI